MIDILLSVIAPHICCGCGSSEGILCSSCKYDIVSEANSLCLQCQKPCGVRGICGQCKVSYDRAWCVGERRGALHELIDAYKFNRARAAYTALGDLLLDVLPVLPPNVVVVPIPTISKHIRQRGYDHTLLIALYFAKKRHVPMKQLLVRQTTTSQRNSSAQVREQQAKQAFAVKGAIEPDAIYLLIDDIVTTGATLRHAARVLKQAGAQQVWVAALARQTLD